MHVCLWRISVCYECMYGIHVCLLCSMYMFVLIVFVHSYIYICYVYVCMCIFAHVRITCMHTCVSMDVCHGVCVCLYAHDACMCCVHACMHPFKVPTVYASIMHVVYAVFINLYACL